MELVVEIHPGLRISSDHVHHAQTECACTHKSYIDANSRARLVRQEEVRVAKTLSFSVDSVCLHPGPGQLQILMAMDVFFTTHILVESWPLVSFSNIESNIMMVSAQLQKTWVPLNKAEPPRQRTPEMLLAKRCTGT